MRETQWIKQRLCHTLFCQTRGTEEPADDGFEREFNSKHQN